MALGQASSAATQEALNFRHRRFGMLLGPTDAAATRPLTGVRPSPGARPAAAGAAWRPALGRYVTCGRYPRLVRYAVAAVVGALVLGFYGLALASAPVRPGSREKVVFEVRPGAGTVTIGSELERQGLIRDRWDFRVLATLLGWNGGLKAGHYELSPGYSTWRTLRKIGRGEVTTIPVTIPEGYTFKQIAALLEEKDLATADSLRKALDDLAARGEIPFLPANRRNFIEPYEGVLFPDTYYFEETVSPETIARTMTRRTAEVFTPELLARAREIKMTPFEVLTLASIIEKEAARGEERPTISSVYHNRLRIGMKMDACPTVRYILDKPPNKPLLFADLEVNSPYNTYKNGGLPPGPIASPGLASIKAALYPADTKYLYFVSKNDGTHQFSRTFEEHLRAVNLYQSGPGAQGGG